MGNIFKERTIEKKEVLCVRKFVSTLLMIMMLALCIPTMVFAKIPDKPVTNVKIDKVWTVTFNKPYDKDSVLDSTHVFINNETTNKRIDTTVKDATSTAFTITATNKFDYSTNYTLHVENVKSSDGKVMKQGKITVKFVTEDKPSIDTSNDKDSDGDGLSDYQEIHKYFTDPNKADTDGDGIPDGDAKERTENTYVIKTTMRIKKPYNFSVMNDDYQDAKLISETDDYGTFEITLYPYNTNTVKSNYNWKNEASDSELSKYLQPTICANFDDELKAQIKSDLKATGLDIDNSTYNGTKIADNQVAERVANYLLNNTKFLDEFTTYFTKFEDGKPVVPSDLREAFDQNKGNNSWSTQEQFNHELFGKQMYENKDHGSCTSTAILWETIFRAIGIPCRIIQTVPIVDGNDYDQIRLSTNGISSLDINNQVTQGVQGAKGFASHDYNEVYVGGRWTRLNYNNLGQPIIDKNYFGAMIHINTFNDLSEIDLLPWGRRYGLHLQDSFKYGNPYETTKVESANGKNSKLIITTFNNPNDKAVKFKIDKFTTYNDEDVPIGYKGFKNDVILAETDTSPYGVDYVSAHMFDADRTFNLKDANGNIIGTGRINPNGVYGTKEKFYEIDNLTCNIKDVKSVEPVAKDLWQVNDYKMY